jgi:DNA-binding CsgD family transcriptional regulator
VILRELRARPIKVTGREREIARLMADGLSYSQIAVRIGWEPMSVRVCAHRLAHRLRGDGPPVVKILRWWFTEGANNC